LYQYHSLVDVTIWTSQGVGVAWTVDCHKLTSTFIHIFIHPNKSEFLL